MFHLRRSIARNLAVYSNQGFSSTTRLFKVMAPKISLTKEEQRLRELLLDVAEYIGSETPESKPQLRFAGGWVRDKLLGSGSQDIDIAVDNMTGLRYAEYMRDFASNSPKSKRYGEDIVKKITKIAARPEQSKNLETATLTVFDLSIDIVNLRKEVYDDASRNPQVEFGTAEEDALRRDATINALFYNLEDGNVEDLTKQGLEDMEQKLIRTPMDPFQTFKDDPLRILRCIRFASRLDYRIEDSAVEAMAIPEIREALRVKITRERIGVEMEKIFKGQRVMQALRYIEDASLYPIVFSNPTWKEVKTVDITGWRSTYEKVNKLVNSEDNNALRDLKDCLILTKEDQQIIWISAALVPYSPLIFKEEYHPDRRDPKTLPALVAREGLKTDNKIRDTIDAAFSRIDKIIDLKHALHDEAIANVSATEGIIKKRRATVTREEVGMLFNDWGVSWRISILVAMICEFMSNNGKDLDNVVGQYHNVLKWIQEQDLLDAHNLKPLVDGRRLLKEVGRPPGPWTKNAVRALLEWQFKNPGVTDPKAGLEEVVGRYGANSAKHAVETSR